MLCTCLEGVRKRLIEAFLHLQICSNDCRHTLSTMCKAWEHAGADEPRKRIEMVVFEGNVEGLARHMVLVALFLHPALSIRDCIEAFLEVFGNALVQEKTLEYISRLHIKKISLFRVHFPLKFGQFLDLKHFSNTAIDPFVH